MQSNESSLFLAGSPTLDHFTQGILTNGFVSERLEQLEVVKVPYSNANDIASIDWIPAAQRIVSLISTGEYKAMQRHNREMAARYDCRFVASKYGEFLFDLASSL